MYRALVATLVGLSFIACGASPETTDSGDPQTTTNECQAQDTWAAGFQADHCEMADESLPTIDPTWWPDVCTPIASAGWSPTQTSFDQLSWRNFLALNWPADSQNPGQPDPTQPLGARADGQYLPVVWETLTNASEIFGASPSATNCGTDGPRVVSMSSKVPQHVILKARAQEGLLESVDQAFRGPLVDQAGNLVYYEIFMNETETRAILDAGAETKSPAQLNCDPPYDKDCTPFEFPVGSVEVKVAWKQLSDEEWSSGRFFSRMLRIDDGTSCETTKMGLVGLHIAHKAEHALNVFDGKPGPSWAWGTFEQVDNVPPLGTSTGRYSFFDGECQPAVTAEECIAAASTGNNKPNPDPRFQCCENLYRYAGGEIPVDPTPNQITRLDAAPAETSACNAVYAKTDLAVFANYPLVTTQWPKGVEGPYAKVVTPAHVRNTVIESYFVEWQGTTQINDSSCMDCHFGGSAVDMSYLFLGNAG